MKHFTSRTQKIGLAGEDIAATYLKHAGFTIIERNYTKKIGEIDIIAQKNGVLHFVEVKSIVSHETAETYNPFENITRSKFKKLGRTIEWYLAERKVSCETPWQIDAIAVIINAETKSAKVEVMWNAII